MEPCHEQHPVLHPKIRLWGGFLGATGTVSLEFDTRWVSAAIVRNARSDVRIPYVTKQVKVTAAKNYYITGNCEEILNCAAYIEDLISKV